MSESMRVEAAIFCARDPAPRETPTREIVPDLERRRPSSVGDLDGVLRLAMTTTATDIDR